MVNSRRITHSLLLSSLLISACFGTENSNEVQLDKISVTATQTDNGSATVPDLSGLRAATSDTASLLRDVPGVSLYGAGGVSSLPVIHGLADDRLRIKVDGMDLIASCPNHMNPALSYVDPTNVDNMKVYTGVSPVSVGGDSIGGSIIAETHAPKFALPGQGNLFEGEVGAFYRSNGNAHGGNLSATYATDSLSVTYAGATAQSDNYDAGGDYRNFSVTSAVNANHPADGAPKLQNLGTNEVGSTAYKTQNHTLGLAYQNSNQLFEAKFGYQDLPYQLYPNQRMDMLDNEEKRINLRYLATYDWGNVEARAYHETVEHFMDFGEDKLYNYGALVNNTYPVNGMPMYTEGKTNGVSVKTEIGLNSRDLLRIGMEGQTYRLNDWWPPAPDCGYTGLTANCTGGMAPDTFWNIRDGKRDRLAAFGEWEAQWNPQLKSLIGLRFEQVKTDSGDIQGYNTGMMYANSSVGTRQAWNDLDRKRTDNNLDITLLTQNTINEQSSIEFGLAQKTRSPNLYERYPWSTNAMAMEMNNFVGDGNGYVGNPDLKPEIAHTVSLTANWHSTGGDYQFMMTPFYTHVHDYIDARRTYPGASAANATATNSFVRLQYVNQEARLYGIDLAGKMSLNSAFGLKGIVNYTNGKNTETGDELYNIMPLNAKVALTHTFDNWNNAIEVIGVKAKDSTSDVRNEIKTSGYSLVNMRGSYSWQKVRIDFGVENLFDTLYYLPLGGAYTGEGATMSLNKEAGTVSYANVNNGSYGASGNTTMWGTAVPGMGRTLYTSINYKF
ncbi:TonB-dependent receptor [Sulfuricurvum kujiense DSM 16994]|uniref:TonB-dependent receptor n=1 Tax=Sulfuricurvum kujiense (strain ATCC BAA-921 / DSM 16994 / JCM 11577 / YK-1) TaxID=709032 RepID=E4TYW1_SULKY|nr:TonB-dependent receptor [Sulfuricurvum kujiense]ADR35121.1 TonB-dependent receptor [Sulfuricurvum kujiense DSM 16994]